MYPGSDGVNGKVGDEADEFSGNGDEEGKIQPCFFFMGMFILIQQTLNKFHAFFVYVDVDGGGDEAGGEGEAVAAV